MKTHCLCHRVFRQAVENSYSPIFERDDSLEITQCFVYSRPIQMSSMPFGVDQYDDIQKEFGSDSYPSESTWVYGAIQVVNHTEDELYNFIITLDGAVYMVNSCLYLADNVDEREEVAKAQYKELVDANPGLQEVPFQMLYALKCAAEFVRS